VRDYGGQERLKAKMEMKAKIENRGLRMGSAPVPGAANGVLADGIFGWFACVSGFGAGTRRTAPGTGALPNPRFMTIL
jgi:hypothetical protein